MLGHKEESGLYGDGPAMLPAQLLQLCLFL